jgi:N-acetylmuramoyl-L-alanine amidase
MSDEQLNTNRYPPDDDEFGDFDACDEFEVHTFDTGSFEAVSPEDIDADAITDDEDDDFQATTVEPETPRRRTSNALRQRRARRRAARLRRQMHEQTPDPVWSSTLTSLLVVSAAAILVSTIFSLWTRPSFFPDKFRTELDRVRATQELVRVQTTPIPTPVPELRIGIIAGHSGPLKGMDGGTDPGAVCEVGFPELGIPPGWQELQINLTVANEVARLLRDEGGYANVDRLEEFDPRLNGYEADVLISIHTNDCGLYDAAATGYNAVAAEARRTTRGRDERLRDCILEEYGAVTGLPRHTGVTEDMTLYHTFSEISGSTPTVIIEIGFMRNDRAILWQQPDLLARGIYQGIECYLEGEGTTVAANP